MRHCGALAEKLRVQHQGEPGERMPVAGMICDERPLDICPRNARERMRVIEEVLVVVEIYEAVVPDGEINEERCNGQQQTKDHRTEKRSRLAGGLDVHTSIKA